MEFLGSFLRRHLVGKPVVGSPCVECFLRRKNYMTTHELLIKSTVTDNINIIKYRSSQWNISCYKLQLVHTAVS